MDWPSATEGKQIMGWTEWKTRTKVFPGFQVRINADTAERDGWVHYLVAPLDEPEPDKNHIHLKGNMIHGGPYLVAGVKVDDMSVISRRRFIEAINRETGLGLRWR